MPEAEEHPLSDPPSAQVLHSLRERVKELSALHRTARVLQDDSKPLFQAMQELAELLPAAWQYPEIAGARVRFDELSVASPGFLESPWILRAPFQIPSGQRGSVEICYREERPEAAEGPFLEEERALIDSLAEMLRAHLRQRWSVEALERAQASLEAQVQARTAELSRMNEALQKEIEAHRRADERIREDQAQLRELTAELCLAEERQRRAIASDLHDHVGQALAFTKARLLNFAGNAVFCGFEHDIRGIVRLLDGIIQYTRTLTCEISPPILFELGLAPALDWLAEQLGEEFSTEIHLQLPEGRASLREDLQILLFLSARELLTNALKHAKASEVRLSLRHGEGRIELQVCDDGQGFDPDRLHRRSERSKGFGLFSIRERMRHLGGGVLIRSAPGEGTCVTLSTPEEQG